MDNTGELIQAITPLYNGYRQQRSTLTGLEVVGIMWEAGDILSKFIKENEPLKPTTLFTMVYGKGKGAKNITQRSYITTEFQSRCYRIRNIFSSKAQIEKSLPNLKYYNLFREAMPFFDNKKYKLRGKEKKELLELLNSTRDYKSVLKEINKLQKTRIGIKNPRTQKHGELEKEKEIFIEFYNSVFRLSEKTPKEIASRLKQDFVDPDYITALARNTNALSQDGLRFTEFTIKDDIEDPIWKDYAEVIRKFSSQNSAVVTRRFRRIIPPERIVTLADMLYSLRKAYQVISTNNKGRRKSLSKIP